MSAKYRAVLTRIWDDSWFHALSGDQQRYWLFLLTNKQTRPSGLYEMVPGLGATYLGLTIEEIKGFRKAFQSLGKAFFSGHWVLLPNYMEHQPGCNPNVWRSIVQNTAQAPEALQQRWLQANIKLIKSLQSDKGEYKWAKKTLTDRHKRLCKDTPKDTPKGLPKAFHTETETGTETGTGTENAPAREEAENNVPADVEQLAMETYGHCSSLAQWYHQYPPPWIPKAIKRTQDRSKDSTAYTKAILEDWRKQGGPDTQKKQRTAEEALQERDRREKELLRKAEREGRSSGRL